MVQKVAGNPPVPVSKVVPQQKLPSIYDFSRQVLKGGSDDPFTITVEHGYGGGTKIAESLRKNKMFSGANTFAAIDPPKNGIGNQYGAKLVRSKITLRPSDVAVIDENDPTTIQKLIKYAEQKGYSYIDNPKQVYESYAKALGKKAFINPIGGQAGRLFIVDTNVLTSKAQQVARKRQDEMWKLTVAGKNDVSAAKMPNQKAFEAAINAGKDSEAMQIFNRMGPDEQKSIPQSTISRLLGM